MQAKAITIAQSKKRLKVLLVHHETMRQASLKHSLGMQYMIYYSLWGFSFPTFKYCVLKKKAFPCFALCESTSFFHPECKWSTIACVWLWHCLLWCLRMTFVILPFPVQRKLALTESHFLTFMLSKRVCLETPCIDVYHLIMLWTYLHKYMLTCNMLYLFTKKCLVFVILCKSSVSKTSKRKALLLLLLLLLE